MENTLTDGTTTLEVAALSRRVAELEEQLRRLSGENRLRAALDSLFVFVAVLTPDGIVTDANRAPLEAWGLRSEEIIGCLFWEIPCWSYSTGVQQRLRDSIRCAARGESICYDVELRARDGELISVEFTVAPLRDKHGSPYLLATSLPILDRKRAEQALRESEAAHERLTGVLESLTDGFVSWDRDLRYIYVNAAGERLLKHSREELLGHSARDVFPEAGNFHRRYEDAMAKQAPVTFEEFYPPFGMWLEVWAYPSAEGLSVFFHDVTERRRTEAALRESEARFRSTFENAAVGMAQISLPGRWLSVNQRLCDILGYSRDELLALKFADITHPEDLEADLAKARDLVAGRIASYQMEKRYLRKDGEIIWANVTVSLLRDERGKPARFIAIAEDISTRKHAENALRVSEATLTSFFDSTSFLMGVVETTENDILTISENAAAKRYFRLLRSGQWASELDVPQEQLELWLKYYRRAQETNRPVQFEYSLIHLGEPRITSVTVSFIHVSRTGRPRFSYVAEDITKRKQAERALRDSETRFRALAEAVPDILFTNTPDGDCDFVSPSFLTFTGLSLDHALGTRWIAALHSDDVARTRETWRRSVATGETFEIEYRFRRHDGVYHWFIARSRPIRDEEGQIVKWFGAATDIENQKQAEAALRLANDDLNRFAFAAAHDLREPLRNVGAYSDMLVTKFAASGDLVVRRAGDVIREGVQRMDQLLSDLLEYSKVTNAASQDAPVDCNAALRHALQNLQQSIAEAGAKIEAGPLPVVPGQESQLIRLFQNLVGNAIKYRGLDPPRVTITAIFENSSWLFAVRDNGIGIDPQFRKHIFGMFKRLHGRDIPGTGIGLAICTKIVESRGGRIWVESEPGQGSQFLFTWPIHRRSGRWDWRTN